MEQPVTWLDLNPDWRVLRIKDVLTEPTSCCFDGDWIEEKQLTQFGVPYITTKNVGSGFFKPGTDFVSEQTAKTCQHAYPGDLVIARIGEPVGRACLLPNDAPHYVISIDVMVLRADALVLKEYLLYYLNMRPYNDMCSMYARGSTLKRISRTQLMRAPILIPPLPEQQRIIHDLTQKTAILNEVIFLSGKMKRHYEHLFLMEVTEKFKQFFSYTFQHNTWKIHSDVWPIKKLHHVAKVVNGNTPPKNEPANYAEDGMDWLKPDQLKGLRGSSRSKEQLSAQGVEKAVVLPKDSILLQAIGRKGHIGRLGFTKDTVAINQQLHGVIPTAFEPKFLYYVFMLYQETFQLLSNGTTIQNLRLKDVRQLHVPCPPLAVQQQFIASLQEKEESTLLMMTEKTRFIEQVICLKQAYITDSILKKE